MALAATYSSIRQHTQARLHLHVLVDESVRSLTRRKLRRCLSCGDKLTFRSVDALPEAQAIAMRMDSRFSPAIIWRAWLPEYLPDLRRCILLDSDLLVLMDINRIWRLRLGRARLSAFPRGTPHPRAYHDWISTPPERYFRMGVCLMDLAGIRRERAFIQGRLPFLEDALEHQRRRSIPMAGLFEQSLYNRFFSARYKPLPFPLCPANRLDQDPQRYHLSDDNLVEGRIASL
jgi:lipopolysaccharide biosynthesis glycosyltransferase